MFCCWTYGLAKPPIDVVNSLSNMWATCSTRQCIPTDSWSLVHFNCPRAFFLLRLLLLLFSLLLRDGIEFFQRSIAKVRDLSFPLISRRWNQPGASYRSRHHRLNGLKLCAPFYTRHLTKGERKEKPTCVCVCDFLSFFPFRSRESFFFLFFSKLRKKRKRLSTNKRVMKIARPIERARSMISPAPTVNFVLPDP